MASGPNSNIPSTSTTYVNHGSNDNIPSTSTTSESLGSNDNIPSTSTTSVSHGSNNNTQSTSTTSVSHGSNDNTQSTSTTSVSHGTNELQSAASVMEVQGQNSRGNISIHPLDLGNVEALSIHAENVQFGTSNTVIYNADQMAKLIGETNEQLEQYRRNERKLFVESPSFKKCQADCEKKRHTAIFGAPGDGKTTIGLEVLCRVQDNTNKKTIIISNKKDWKKVNLPSSNVQELVIFFDDMLGKFVLNENLKNFWISELPKILSFVQNGKIQVIITCRESIFFAAKNELESFKLFNTDSRIHLSGPNSKYPLDEETQFNIIKKHIELGENIEICGDKSKEVLSPPDQHCRISVDTLRIISRKSYVGYMQMCKNFLSPEFLSEGVGFFHRAGDFLIREINRLQSSSNEDEKYNYCTLACVLVKQKLNVEKIDGDETVKKIVESCGINTTTNTIDCLKSKLNLAVERLTSTYLIKINDEYQFQHNSWVESVFKSFLKSNASLLFKYCKFGLIEDLITTENNGEKFAGLCELSKSRYESLFQRLVLEMAAGFVRRVFFHRCFTDADFTQKLCDWLDSDKERKQAVLMSGAPDSDLWGRLSERSVLYWAARKSDIDFIVWAEKRLRQSGKWDMKVEMSAALRSACLGGNLHVCKWLLLQAGIEVRDECIADAARNGHVNVVKTLLNSDKTFSCHDLSQGLWRACLRGDIDVCNEILTQPGVDRGRKWGECLSEAARYGNIDVVTALMNYGQFTSDDLCQGLHGACQFGHIDVFRLLLTQPGVDRGWWWGECLSLAAECEKLRGDSRFAVLLRTKGYVIPDF